MVFQAPAETSAQENWGTDFDDTALGNGVMPTLIDELAQFATQRLEIDEFTFHFDEMLSRDAIDVGTGPGRPAHHQEANE